MNWKTYAGKMENFKREMITFAARNREKFPFKQDV